MGVTHGLRPATQFGPWVKIVKEQALHVDNLSKNRLSDCERGVNQKALRDSVLAGDPRQAMSDFAVAIEGRPGPAKRRALLAQNAKNAEHPLIDMAKSHRAARLAGDATLDRSISRPSPALTGRCITAAKVLHAYLSSYSSAIRTKTVRSKSEMAWSIKGGVKNIFVPPPGGRGMVRAIQPSRHGKTLVWCRACS
jgi:hypothetical protein